MGDWIQYELNELLPYEQPTAYIVESTDYSDSYKTPVLTAGKSFILGYTNETEGVFTDLPVIIFDDFTTATQFVNFKFKVKSSAMKILHVNTDIVLPKFIFYRMQIINFDHSTHKRYWIQQYSKIKVPVPPLPEQERIVASIEELFSELDKAVETLQKTKQQLAVYRQAVLKELLTNKSWCTYKLKELVETEEGDRGKNYPKRDEYLGDGHCLFLNAKNVRPYGWNFQNTVFISADKHNLLRGGTLQRGDVVITTRGTLGNVAVYDSTVPYNVVRINSCMLILRCNRHVISPYYLSKFIMSPMFRSLIQDEKSGTAQPQIPANQLRELKICVPPLDEQNFIINEIESRLSVCDSIEQAVDTALAQAEALRQSILKEAFEGRLV